MREIRITHNPDTLEKLIEYFEGGVRVGYEVHDGFLRELEGKMSKFFYPDERSESPKP